MCSKEAHTKWTAWDGPPPHTGQTTLTQVSSQMLPPREAGPTNFSESTFHVPSIPLT